jgi:hypothetical protein
MGMFYVKLLKSVLKISYQWGCVAPANLQGFNESPGLAITVSMHRGVGRRLL